MRVSGKHNDLDNVGPSLRHHTFFEMLGNFSFGDYFKDDAIPFAWELLTTVWKLPTDRLFPTIFKGEAGIPRDDEAFAIWTQFVPGGSRSPSSARRTTSGRWARPGPCGRCSEIILLSPATRRAPSAVCRGIECSCDRYVEVWNNVFMEFDRAGGGDAEAAAGAVDRHRHGPRAHHRGASRASCRTTTPTSSRRSSPRSASAAGRTYTRFHGGGDHPDVSMRVIADHLRAMTFLIADGVLPSNEWRGYVLRKIMRRAMRHGKKLGLHRAVPPRARRRRRRRDGRRLSGAPPQPRHRSCRSVRSEEERFDAVLTAGLPRLEELLDRAAARLARAPGDEVFRLYDSLGVPLDFIEDLAGQRGLAIDREGFERAMEGQRERARAAARSRRKKAQDFAFASDDGRATALARRRSVRGLQTRRRSPGMPIVALFDAAAAAESTLGDGQTGFVVLDRTPFYLEAGGQVSDAGAIANDATGASAHGRRRSSGSAGRPRAHRVTVDRRLVHAGDIVTAAVDDAARDATRRNHTATHLLHAALRQVLGTHVKQAGSLVAPDRLRFDFAHFAAITRDASSTDRADRQRADLPQHAGADRGAIDRRGDGGRRDGAVRREVRRPGPRRVGPGLQPGAVRRHARRAPPATSASFVITEESGVAAGVRRIEALTGAGAVRAVPAAARGARPARSARSAPTPEQSVEAVAAAAGRGQAADARGRRS